jgi:hypothetical protein
MLSVRGIRGRILSNSRSRPSLALRVTQAYVSLSSIPKSDAGTRIVSLVRCGELEVRLIEFSRDSLEARLVEFSRTTNAGEPPLWVDLYDHALGVTIDSCRCGDVDEAISAAEHLLTQARVADGPQFGGREAENN